MFTSTYQWQLPENQLINGLAGLSRNSGFNTLLIKNRSQLRDLFFVKNNLY